MKRKQQRRHLQGLGLRQQAARSQQAPTGVQRLLARALLPAGRLRAGRRWQQPMLPAPRPQQEGPLEGPRLALLVTGA